MIIAIRISGIPEVPSKIEEILFRLRLRRKYSAVLLKETVENKKLLQSVRDYIAYGKIDSDTLVELIEKRAKTLKDKKIDAKKVAEQVEKSDLESLGIKPFFRLHPPIGGIDTKHHFPIKKGVLGDHKDQINVLVRKML